ncbi:tetratricopeptide repeat protein 23 isoform X5 [Callorhinus ursinus]|uniref:tetratricopeptide repeat protein 23 isoform X5 n=1 Tax=Callorhinus ursinus TaxID=34884 RepID=UPI003CD015CF
MAITNIRKVADDKHVAPKDNVYKNMQESKETPISSHLDEIVAAISITPRKKIQNKLPQTALFQPPREKLHLCEEKAKSYSSSHEYKQAVHELVRCIALTRICYGDSHWKLAEAHINLAQGYLQLKGLSLQAKQHAEKAKEILTSSIVPPYDDNTDVFRIYQSQKKPKEALPHYQEALEYIEISRGEKSLECVPILRELAGVEQALGLHDASINHFLQAHLIVLSRSPSQEEAAVSAHFVAHAGIASGRTEHHDVAEQYFQESMANLKDAEGTGKARFLSIQDDYCRFLQVTGQKERATSILRESLEAKVAMFGDLSPEVAETYRLLGGADLAQGNHSGAHKKLKKLSWRKMMVACSKTVARGWSKVMGESRDVDKDVEATAHGSSEEKMKSILARMLALDRGLSLPSRSDGKACLLPACSPFLSTFSAGPCMETPPGFQQRGATQKRRAGNLSPKAVQDFLRFPNFLSSQFICGLKQCWLNPME